MWLADRFEIENDSDLIMNITQTTAWQTLLQHRNTVASGHLRNWFAADPNRFSNLSLEVEGLLVDFSRQRLDLTTLDLLFNLAVDADVAGWRDRLFAGEKINISENRAVLHPALRHLEDEAYPSLDDNILKDVAIVRGKMRLFTERVRNGLWHGFSGETIRDVVNIGIGGSDLGPRLAVHALAAWRHPELKFHFVSNLDSADMAPLLDRLDPRTTLFVVVSKSFTTQETMINAATARDWLGVAASGWAEDILARHFVAVTAEPALAREFGLPEENIFRIWDWVGGRYSLWSAAGLAIALAVGMDKFDSLLMGAHAMDRHFLGAPLAKNLPVLMALIGIWNSNFLGAETNAVLPYNESLRYLPAFLQQLEMESNGKTVGRDGQPLACKANPVVWGAIGSNGQHAFFQLLHQGGWLVPCDFIASVDSNYPLPGHQAPLLANCFAQAAALAFGRTESEARAQLEADGIAAEKLTALLPHKVFTGNQPSTMILLPKVDAYYLGFLLALYEHKTFVQGVIWGVNSFDQWGVEIGKQLAGRLLPALYGVEDDRDGIDASTSALVDWCRKQKAF